MPIKHPRLWTYSLPVALVLLAPFNILASLGMDIYLPIVPAMPAILGTTPEVVQLTLTLYMIMLGVGQIIFGPLSDRFGRRPILIGGVFVFAVTSLALAVTTSAWLFVFLRLVQAAGAAAMLVAVFATVRDVYADTPESAVIYSLMNAMLAFVPAFGPIAGALIARYFGWEGIFIALCFSALIALPFVLPKWHETRQSREHSSRADFSVVLRSPYFWVYTLAFGTAMGSFFVFFSTAPRVLPDDGQPGVAGEGAATGAELYVGHGTVWVNGDNGYIAMQVSGLEVLPGAGLTDSGHSSSIKFTNIILGDVCYNIAHIYYKNNSHYHIY